MVDKCTDVEIDPFDFVGKITVEVYEEGEEAVIQFIDNGSPVELSEDGTPKVSVDLNEMTSFLYEDLEEFDATVECHTLEEGTRVKITMPKENFMYFKDDEFIFIEDLSHIQGEKSKREASKETVQETINNLVELFIAACQKDEKVVLAIDSELGEGEINRLIRKMIDIFPDVKDNNKSLKLFLKNLEIVKGEGESLAQRLKNITDSSKGDVKAENVLIIAKSGNLEHFKSFNGKSIITGIDDSVFAKTGYLPLPEIMLFTVGRYLGWDENTMRQHYAMIPNVIAEGDLTEEDYDLIFGKGNRTMIIRLIPDAEALGVNELRDLMNSIKIMLARA